MTSPSQIYEVSYTNAQSSGTIPIAADSRKDAVETIKGRLGPGTVAVVTGCRD